MIDKDSNGDDFYFHFHFWGAAHNSKKWICMSPNCNATIDMSGDNFTDNSKPTLSKDIFIKDEYITFKDPNK